MNGSIEKCWNWLIGFLKEAFTPATLIGVIYFVLTLAYSYYEEAATRPYARQSVYFSSQDAFPSELSREIVPPAPVPQDGSISDDLCSPVTHVRYEVENRGPGDLEDVRIVVCLTPDERSKIKAESLFAGQVEFTKDGTADRIIVTTQKGGANRTSPLKPGQRFGIQLTMPMADWAPGENDVLISQGSEEEIPITDNSPPPTRTAPYRIAFLSTVFVLGYAIYGAYFRHSVSKKAENDLQQWKKSEEDKIRQEARQHAADVLSASDETTMTGPDIIALLENVSTDT
ncbi:hypothetical protein [Neorhodopirellula pilleata]|uniref:Uncharacterized protein n=1 Tax=Neorhodopirellula pilleata TaxID=2714738 RepID=A0A5C5ZPC1_9BACT|nr:hypothetical protein [Neorhodopirellula pilleata]TWT89319.1 hypothetical protein Pla100_56360 [Neorhodopirellula pilleata]